LACAFVCVCGVYKRPSMHVMSGKSLAVQARWDTLRGYSWSK
jgi:hypothetical protein